MKSRTEEFHRTIFIEKRAISSYFNESTENKNMITHAATRRRISLKGVFTKLLILVGGVYHEDDVLNRVVCGKVFELAVGCGNYFKDK